MAFSNNDWGEILGHMRRRVREVGFADLDERLTLDFQASNDARADFARYLSSLLAGLNERSLSGYTKALRTLQDVLEVEDGQHVEGIEVLLSDSDSRLFDRRILDLGTVEDLTPLIRELESLKAYLIRKGFLDE